MAVDTRNKRASAIGVGLAFRLVLPLADGAVETIDRPHVAYCYALAADEAVVVDICSTTVVSLMPERTLSGLMPARTVASGMPVRTLAHHCED